MSTSQLSVKLPESQIDFLKDYAKQNHVSVSQLVERWIQSLKSKPKPEIHPDIKKYTGIIPPDINAKEAYAEYIMKKHDICLPAT